MRVLIVGTLEGYVSTAAKIAMAKGGKVSHVPDIDSALVALRGGKGADLILVDLKLEVRDLIHSLENERISVPVVACGIAADPKMAVSAIQAGAREYLPLPPDPNLIAAVLHAVSDDGSPLICQDPVMLRSVAIADRIAPSDASVLITGESGTGKEVMAHYIHEKSKRRTGPFISVNCAAIPENLLESELFGHEKGAFTGAVARRLGKFEEANGGTLLLDEISEMHPRLQAKLLRAIQEREIDRVGGTQPVRVNIRIIATSNRDLPEAVKAHEFREDLYFRLNVINIQLPGLRERPLDIDSLAKFFVKKYAELNRMDIKGFSKEALLALRTYSWPGNVRELENTVYRSMLLAQGDEIQADEILYDHAYITEKRPGGDEKSSILVGRTVSEVERDLILDTLQHCLGNRTHAANILGISIRTLRNKLKEYTELGLKVPAHAGKDDETEFVSIQA